jgi:hypothetical protein
MGELFQVNQLSKSVADGNSHYADRLDVFVVPAEKGWNVITYVNGVETETRNFQSRLLAEHYMGMVFVK